MSKLHRIRLLMCVNLLTLTTLVHGVGGNGWESASDKDADYHAALTAVEREDWAAAAAALQTVLSRREWDDDAHTLLGFVHRKRGDYQASLAHYRRALELNPYHRGALEYLGEAYLQLGDEGRATETLKRLGSVCRRLGTHPDSESWKQSCPEWGELKAVIQQQTADPAARPAAKHKAPDRPH